MKRFLTVAVIFAASFSLTASATAYEKRYTNHHKESCRFRGPNEKWSGAEVRDTIRCAARQWNVDGHTALRVADCESGFSPYAYNSGGYAGVFQHSTRYWPSRQNTFDRHNRWNINESVFNARSNIIVSIRMVHRGGWSPWACY